MVKVPADAPARKIQAAHFAKIRDKVQGRQGKLTVSTLCRFMRVVKGMPNIATKLPAQEL